MRELVEKTIREMGLYSPEAAELLLGTCAQESAYGKYRKQLGGGPALGIFQCEPATFNDIVDNFLNYKKELLVKIIEVSKVQQLNAADLETNDILATCICRVHYLRVDGPVPKDLDGWARYYKQYYNTPGGKATEEEFKANYRKYVLKEG